MPAKRKITIKRKEKVETPIVEEEAKVETPMEEIEKAVDTVVEEEISVTEVVEPKKVKVKDRVAWKIWNSAVIKPQWRIKFEAQVAPMPLFLLPADIRQYLINHGLTSDVYKKDKEWLEKHNVDMEMVEKLKKFLTEKL